MIICKIKEILIFELENNNNNHNNDKTFLFKEFGFGLLYFGLN